MRNYQESSKLVIGRIGGAHGGVDGRVGVQARPPRGGGDDDGAHQNGRRVGRRGHRDLLAQPRQKRTCRNRQII